MRIEELCSKGGITRYQLSSRTGISQSALSDIVKKKNVPTLVTIERICAAFGITIAQFFTQSDSIPNLSDEQKELLLLWDGLKLEEKEIVKTFMKSIRKWGIADWNTPLSLFIWQPEIPFHAMLPACFCVKWKHHLTTDFSQCLRQKGSKQMLKKDQTTQ